MQIKFYCMAPVWLMDHVRCMTPAGLIALALSLSIVPARAQTSTEALTVTIAQVKRSAWPLIVSAGGAIAPWEEQIISAAIGGLRIMEIKKSVGETVRRGQVLVRFDSEGLRIDARELAATVGQYEAADKQAQDSLLRALEIKDSGAISAQEIVQNDTQAHVAHEQLLAARARLDAKRWQVRNATVLAPDDGIISARSATAGSVSAAGQELFRIIRRGRLEWRGELTAEQLPGIAAGQPVQLTLPDGSIALARVRQIGASLSTPGRLATVYADLETTATARAAMYVNGRIEIGVRAANSVPAAAVVIRDGRSLVARVESKGKISTVTMIPVVTGRHLADQVEILQGVTAGDLVVDRGAGFLGQGDIVKIVTIPATTAAPAKSNGGG